MTEERLVEILIDSRLSRGYVGDEISETIKEAMKQAVNEALEEAAEKGALIDPAMNIKCKSGHGFEVDKQSILNLKVK